MDKLLTILVFLLKHFQKGSKMKKGVLLFFTAVLPLLADQPKLFSPSINFYGLTQYRLRGEATRFTADDNKTGMAVDYFNRVGFYLGTLAKLNDQVTMQLQIGNDWISTEDVKYLANNPSNVKEKKYPFFSVPYFSLAYAKWDPGYFKIAAGIIPLFNYGPLDLIERSLALNSYNSAALISWAVGSNNAMLGAQIGAPVLKGDFKLGVELFSTVVDSRKQTAANESSNTVITDPKKNPGSVMFVMNVPMSSGAFTFTPQFVGILNRLYRKSIGGGDNEVAGGFTAATKIGKSASAYVTAACSRLSNEHSRLPVGVNSDTVDFAQADVFDFHGFITGAGSNVDIGPGTLFFDFKYSMSEDVKVDSSQSNYIFADLKYSWNINKYISLMPRVRLFTTIYAENNPGLDYKNVIRPELIFTGKF